MDLFGRRLKYLYFGTGLLTLGLLYQNMAHVDTSQTQELLVQKAKTSPAQRIEGKYNLQYHIYNKVRRSLPRNYKAKADEISAAIIEESEKQGLDPVFTLAVIQTESNFNPNAKDKIGDSGLMQIQPETAKWIAATYDIPWEGKKALFDPVYNIKIGTTYFAHLRSEFDIVPKDYARAYNPGPTAIPKDQSRKVSTIKKNQSKQMNAHILNRIYARKVMKTYALLYKSFNKTMEPKTKRLAVSNN